MELKLHTPGNGLFGTHITWKDIEQRIQKELKQKVCFGPKKSAQLIGDGNGFLSRNAVIEGDFQGETDGLPSKFIVKMFTAVACREMIESIKDRNEGIADVEEIYGMYEKMFKDYTKKTDRRKQSSITIYWGGRRNKRF
ncbi:hypothetical protein NECAME_08785 [Necator americanus]|uniref:Uncharacterized protein n=1 Tax=Necator americanus TaxID=51031 RepID=W2TJ27_NECAM|nr:hypothetical protein NECAME_08785 [Necator americanus]ETN81032.1 hypothetical protein NECAME_08785 [Necator americanus]